LIAKAYLPSGSHIKEALFYLDMATKIELVLVRKLHSLKLFIARITQFALLALSFGSRPFLAFSLTLFHRPSRDGLHLVPLGAYFPRLRRPNPLQ